MPMGAIQESSTSPAATTLKPIAPSKFAHIVYKTHHFEMMLDWYVSVFNARVQHRDERLAFLTYDDEHHRFAFVNLGPATEERPRREDDAGVHHVAYTWKSLDEFVATTNVSSRSASCRCGQFATD